ncbi:MAG: ferritin [Saprospiraceae bacterium]|nr:ferritin [Saprospiraceae bacterium]
MADLSTKIIQLLDSQILKESYASNFYLALSYWCDDQGLKGYKSFFLRQSEEERIHMLKIYEYMSEMGVHPTTPAIEQPPMNYTKIKEVFEKVFEQERSVTKAIHEIVRVSTEENDYSTLNFMQWYISEQREEEAVIRDIIDKIKVIGDGGQSLYYIDKEVDKLNLQIQAAEGGEEQA